MDNKDTNLDFGFDVAYAERHLAELIRKDQDRNQFMTAALEQLIDRESRLNTMALELEDQRSSRCHYQQKLKDLQNKFHSLNRKIAKAAFVAVLIDGDGAKFTDELLQAQEKGGAEAACRLKGAVHDYLRKEDPELLEEDTPIVVKLWANLGGLSNALYNNGSIGARGQMSEFAESFSRSRAEFDFINVGRGKENADSKMRRMFNFYYNNVQCKKIIFAGGHDTGYIHDLQEKQGTEEAKQRIVLLETTPAEPQFRRLGFSITRFDSVFRNAPLDNGTKQPQTLYLDAKPSESTQVAVTSPPVRSGSPSLSQVRPTPEHLTKIPNDEFRSNVNTSNNGRKSLNYASAGRNIEQQNIDISTSKNKRSRYILYNAAQHRLDPPNERSWRADVQQTYNTKMERVKPKAFCNDYYLLGDCPRSTLCPREHNATLTSEEIAIHRYRARTGPCAVGPLCQNFDCYSSHHCPAGRHCSKGGDCLFSRTFHGDLHLREQDEGRPALKWIEGRQFPEKTE